MFDVDNILRIIWNAAKLVDDIAGIPIHAGDHAALVVHREPLPLFKVFRSLVQPLKNYVVETLALAIVGSNEDIGLVELSIRPGREEAGEKFRYLVLPCRRLPVLRLRPALAQQMRIQNNRNILFLTAIVR